MILITDSLAYASPYITEYYGEVGLVGGVPTVVKSGTLAGSNLKMNLAIKNCVERCGVDVSAALYAATEGPARLLNIFETRGSIEVGKRADLVILKADFEVIRTISNGIEFECS